MRKLIVTENMTIDGVIELGDWFRPGEDPEVVEALHEQDAASDALLLGRQTFEDFRGYWPLQTEDRSGIAAQLDAVTKYVVSRSLGEPGWQHTTVLNGDPLAEVRALKEAPGRDIIATGSI